MTNGQPPTTPNSQPPQPQYQPPQTTQPQYQPQPPKVYAQAGVRQPRGFSRFIPGLVVAVLAVALLAVGIVFIGGSKKMHVPTGTDTTSGLTAAKSGFDSNNATAASAPQQAVVNGWYTNDLLIVTAEAVDANNNTAIAIADGQQKVLDSNRTLSLILVGSVGVLLLAFGAFFILKAALD